MEENKIDESHYKQTKAQVIDLLTELEQKAFYKANILKYVARFEYKNGVNDLYKAQRYLQWLIELEEKYNELKNK